MEKHTVALIPIATYDQAAVDTAVLQGVDLLGGIARFVQPEDRVLLKPNLLSRALPQKAITTHPAVFSAVCRLLRESGYKVTLTTDESRVNTVVVGLPQTLIDLGRMTVLPGMTDEQLLQYLNERAN